LERIGLARLPGYRHRLGRFAVDTEIHQGIVQRRVRVLSLEEAVGEGAFVAVGLGVRKRSIGFSGPGACFGTSPW
jgi:hypothetical protein